MFCAARTKSSIQTVHLYFQQIWSSVQITHTLSHRLFQTGTGRSKNVQNCLHKEMMSKSIHFHFPANTLKQIACHFSFDWLFVQNSEQFHFPRWRLVDHLIGTDRCFERLLLDSRSRLHKVHLERIIFYHPLNNAKNEWMRLYVMSDLLVMQKGCLICFWLAYRTSDLLFNLENRFKNVESVFKMHLKT